MRDTQSLPPLYLGESSPYVQQRSSQRYGSQRTTPTGPHGTIYCQVSTADSVASDGQLTLYSLGWLFCATSCGQFFHAQYCDRSILEATTQRSRHASSSHGIRSEATPGCYSSAAVWTMDGLGVECGCPHRRHAANIQSLEACQFQGCGTVGRQGHVPRPKSYRLLPEAKDCWRTSSTGRCSRTLGHRLQALDWCQHCIRLEMEELNAVV